ncbi:MAG: phosphoribosylformylglycinamidine cyclo-ligase, partial [Candidatus Thermoplasmatota archaeon]|nr:phosphoribosylformylglycinamidine cyclo-ligase [Candidatus Thermoplasmatota archaeon]
YAEAGVDIEKKSDAIKSLVNVLGFSRQGVGKRVEMDGGYAGFIEFGSYALGLCTDGVGTKIMIANAVKKWDTIGIDCVAMNANDLVCVGAEPLAFVDYIAIDKPDNELARQIGLGLQKGAELANVSLVGGEFAILPQMVNGFDLAGTCMGWVKKSKLITGKKIAVGDAIIGMKSSGVHSNGLSLARKVLEVNEISYDEKFAQLDRPIGLELLEPTKMYVKEILSLLRHCEIHGMAHITGSGLRNLVRLHPKREFRIEKPLEPQPVFKILEEMGNISDKELYQTFNMGMGMAIVLPEKHVKKALAILNKTGEAKEVGRVYEGTGACNSEVGVEYHSY